MHPILVEIGPVTLYTYGFLLALAYLAGLQMAIRRAQRRGLDGARVLDLGIYVIVSALVGAKLLLVLVDFDYFWQHPSDLFSIVRSGGVFYGGLIMAVVVAFWYMRRRHMPLWTTCDAFAPGIALGHVIGRFGCFMAGCCYGRPTGLPWGVTFTSPFAGRELGTPLGVPLHPTQLYEAGAAMLILVVLLTSERRGRQFPGRTFWGYLLLYGVSRFVIEFFRGDERGMVGLLSTSQFISVVLVPLSIGMLWWLSRRPPADAAVAPAPGDRRRR